MAEREPPLARQWRERAELHQRNVQRLMFQNAQLIVLVGALLPALWERNQPRCISCGITLTRSADLRKHPKKYCSQRCNQRAWRLRKAIAA